MADGRRGEFPIEQKSRFLTEMAISDSQKLHDTILNQINIVLITIIKKTELKLFRRTFV